MEFRSGIQACIFPGLGALMLERGSLQRWRGDCSLYCPGALKPSSSLLFLGAPSLLPLQVLLLKLLGVV